MFCAFYSDPEDSESEIRVGFVTYSNVLHFYNLKVSLLGLGKTVDMHYKINGVATNVESLDKWSYHSVFHLLLA